VEDAENLAGKNAVENHVKKQKEGENAKLEKDDKLLFR
tara:strand:+ start:65 stop:178 length:114 start_codon:yes stop_codon:yes gene_type:complete